MAIADQHTHPQPASVTPPRAPGRGPTITRFLPAIVLAALTVAAVAWFARSPSPELVSPSDGTALASSTSMQSLAVEAVSAYEFATLDDMVAASDLIVVGEVLNTSRGRLVGDSTNGVLSRLVTLRIDEQLAPSEPRASGVVIEEEGWLPDGTPLIVSGATPSAEGDRGVWFLDRIETGDAETYVVINAQGRFLDVGGELRGPDQDDALVQDVQRLSLLQLAATIRSISER